MHFLHTERVRHGCAYWLRVPTLAKELPAACLPGSSRDRAREWMFPQVTKNNNWFPAHLPEKNSEIMQRTVYVRRTDKDKPLGVHIFRNVWGKFVSHLDVFQVLTLNFSIVGPGYKKLSKVSRNPTMQDVPYLINIVVLSLEFVWGFFSSQCLYNGNGSFLSSLVNSFWMHALCAESISQNSPRSSSSPRVHN